MTEPRPPVEVFSSDAVLLDIRGTTKQEVLEELVQHAVDCKGLPRTRKDQVLAALLEREERASTGFGKGVAMPHAKIPGLKRQAGVVGRSVEGIDFRAVDGEPVHAFVMLISPESRSAEHLATLRWVSGMARDPDFVSFIRQATSPEDVLDVLRERAP